MKTSSRGIELIKSFEGCHLTAYKCPAGVWTIGYGHTAGVKEGQVITQNVADTYLKSDLEKYEKYVNATAKELGLNFNQNQFDALVSFTYNCGAVNLNTLVRGRTLEQIADALLLYKKSGGKVLAGLERRRQAERELFLKEEKVEVFGMIKPVDYKQTDSKWGTMKYAVDGENSTIKSAGCGPTAMADVLAAIISPYVDPITCASWARMKGYKVYKSGTSYNYPVAQGAAYGLKVRRLNTANIYGNSGNAVHNEALKELQNGNWLIACMGKGIWTNSGHYIVVYGYQNGKVYINDPASSVANRACNTWDVFKSQVKYYWAVDVPEEIKKNGIKKDGEYLQKDFVREVQFCCKAGLDGIAGPQTLGKTVTVSAKENRKHAVVLPLQKMLKSQGKYTGALDKIAGAKFTAAVNAYQSIRLGYRKPDGEITEGGKMWRKLLGI